MSLSPCTAREKSGVSARVGGRREGNPFLNCISNPLNHTERPCYKWDIKAAFDWGEENDVCQVPGNCKVFPVKDSGGFAAARVWGLVYVQSLRICI